jgi:hypothetical protein
VVLAAEKGKKKHDEEKEVGAVEDLDARAWRPAPMPSRLSRDGAELAPQSRCGRSRRATADRELVPQLRRGRSREKAGGGIHFPASEKAGGPAALLTDILKPQHDRGREINAYVLEMAGKGSIDTGDAEPLAQALEGFVLMYRNHAAREDTIVFPAWKEALSERQLREMGDKFEEIERKTFGHNGFEDAIKQIAAIEQGLGLADLAKFTVPPPKA